MNNILNNLQFNEVISISSIIIIYEFIILLLLLFKIINNNLSQNLLSPLIILNFFMIFVMFLTDCKIDTTTKIYIVTLKIILLFIVLFFTKFSLKNYFLGLIFLFVYFLISNINKVYSCNVNILNLIQCLGFSTIIYLFISNYHSTTKTKN